MMNIFIILLIGVVLASARELLELQGDSFELALTTYKYVAILFVDNSRVGQNVRREWFQAAELMDDLPNDAEIAVLPIEDDFTRELVTAYGITLPSARVFRRGVSSDYRGPYDAEGIAKFIMEDSQPSVKKLSTIKEMKALLENNANTILFGLFNEDDIVDESMEGYSIDAWGQYQAAADALRGHASFYLVDSKDILNSFKLKPNDLPVVYMVSNEGGEGFMKYTGEILEMNLAEWVLRHSSPGMGELSISTSTGELYATQFFSSKKLKFILFVTHDMISSTEVLDNWKAIAEVYKGRAIFSYMTEAVADVVEYFDINLSKDIPMIAAHQPSNDHKFKSSRIDMSDLTTLENFVSGVMSGSVLKVLKSEPIPKVNEDSVLKAVGNTVLDIVNNESKDVLLMVYTPWCANCRKVLPAVEMLSRAVSAEPRIVIARIDASLNDIPSSWEVKSYPTLLWFPKKEKPYAGVPTPKPYWDAHYSLPELVGFVQRQSSFDMKTLKIATSEQIASLIQEEDLVRAVYTTEERHWKRNQGRVQYENEWVDYFMGEVIFDGTRFHYIVFIVLILCVVVESLLLVGMYLFTSTSTTTKKKKTN